MSRLFPRARWNACWHLAAALKKKQRHGIAHALLKGKTLGLLFQKPSTRTRVSFEAGMHQLGGHALVLPMADIQLSRGESVADTARVLSRYLDGIVIRTYDHGTSRNGRRSHDAGDQRSYRPQPPVPGLVRSDDDQGEKGKLKGIKIAYMGDGNNVANSLIEAGAKMGMAISLGCPVRLSAGSTCR